MTDTLEKTEWKDWEEWAYSEAQKFLARLMGFPRAKVAYLSSAA